MTRIIARLAAAAFLLAPLTVAAAQAQSSLDRDPADSRIQGTVQPMTPMGSAGIVRSVARSAASGVTTSGSIAAAKPVARRNPLAGPRLWATAACRPARGECFPTRTTSSARSAAIRLMAEHGGRRADPAIERIFEQLAGMPAHRCGSPVPRPATTEARRRLSVGQISDSVRATSNARIEGGAASIANADCRNFWV